jgi:membrane protein implicated in regulation of membrane protease activity
LEDYDRPVAAWLVWALVAVLLAIGEVLTPGLFFLGPIALAAAAAAAAAALGGGWVIELVVFVVGSGASVGGLRPIARRHIRMPFSTRTGAAALVGASAVVLERVDVHGGRVKIGGEVWSARTFDESQVLEPGTRVQVAEIQGATALVYA